VCYFAKENAFQVVADRTGKFINKSFSNYLDPQTNKWRIGESVKRGKYSEL
jgi:hypothetical protein